MSFLEKSPPPVDTGWTSYAEKLKKYLDKVKVVLATKLIFDQRTTYNVADGEMSWNTTDDTLNIGHADGVVQQVGLEQYMRARNDTGATIANGTVVGFAGVSGEIQMSKYIADGSAPSLYFIGVATQTFSDGEVGMVTTYGKVRDLDTSAFSVGDILYASPTTAGGLTNTRPTAPDEVIVVAACLVSSATAGEIMVRPTIPIGLGYGSFSDTTDQTIAAINTAYPIQFNTTDVSHGITVVSDGTNPTRLTVAQAGLYAVSVSNQYTSSNASAQNIQTWLRQNGTDIANSNSYTTIANNGATTIFATTYLVSMQADDYLQVMWSSDSVNVSIDNIPATAWSPAAPSTIVTINQTQL